MGIVEAIKNGFGKSSKLINVVIVFFAFNVVIGLLSLPLANPANAGNPGVVAVSVISSVVFFLAFIFLQGGALGLVKDNIKTGSIGMAQFVAYGKKYYLRILGLLLLYILIAVGVVLILSLLSAGILLMGDNFLTRSLVAALVTAAAAAVITFLLFPIYAVVVDDVGAITALKKGIATAKENFWKTLGLFTVMLIVSLVISLVIGFIVGLLTVPLSTNVSQVLIAIVNAAVQSYIPIVMMIAFMGFYLSLEDKTAGQQSSASGPGDLMNQ